jgi:hypothetical protein
MLPLGDQPLVQLAGEQRDAVRPGVVAKEVASEANLAAAAALQDFLIEVRPLLYWLLTGSLGPAATNRRHRRRIVHSYQRKPVGGAGRRLGAAGAPDPRTRRVLVGGCHNRHGAEHQWLQ